MDLFDAKSALPMVDAESDLIKQMFFALVKTKLRRMIREKGLFFWGTIMPVIFVVIGMVLVMNISPATDNSDPTPLKLVDAISQYKSPGILLNNSVSKCN